MVSKSQQAFTEDTKQTGYFYVRIPKQNKQKQIQNQPHYEVSTSILEPYLSAEIFPRKLTEEFTKNTADFLMGYFCALGTFTSTHTKGCESVHASTRRNIRPTEEK